MGRTSLIWQMPWMASAVQRRMTLRCSRRANASYARDAATNCAASSSRLSWSPASFSSAISVTTAFVVCRHLRVVCTGRVSITRRSRTIWQTARPICRRHSTMPPCHETTPLTRRVTMSWCSFTCRRRGGLRLGDTWWETWMLNLRVGVFADESVATVSTRKTNGGCLVDIRWAGRVDSMLIGRNYKTVSMRRWTRKSK